MGKETKRKRKFAIHFKLHKREKIGKLKARYLTADMKERERILIKIQKLSPGYPIGELGKAKQD
jgi:hypothetical protein